MKKLLKFLLCLTAPLSFSQNLELDAELVEINYHYSSNPKDFSLFQNRLYFSGLYQGLEDYSIFNYDGGNFQLMKNNEGRRIISNSGTFGENLLYFIGSLNQYDNNRFLWVSDGSENSAIPLLEIQYYSNTGMTTIGDRLFFVHSDSSGYGLWTTNGTVESTHKLKDLYWDGSGSYLRNSIVSEEKYYFLTGDPTYGEELWVSDGTASGTYLLKDIYEGVQGSRVNSLFNFNNKIYFVANNGVSGSELWVSDGTSNGTYMIKDINSGNYGSFDYYNNEFIQFEGNFYFFANDGTNVQLWKSDGTTDGTVLFKNVNTFQWNSSYQTVSINGEVTDGYFVFKAYNYNSSNQQYIEKLWKSDGTNEGTLEFIELNSNYSPFSNSQFDRIQNKIYFTQESTYPNKKLWVTDGTNSGTTSVVDGFQEYSGFKIADNNIFLKAKIDHSEDEILKIDYLSNNYSVFLDNVINPERGFGIYNNELYFGFDYNSYDNNHPNGGELWKSDLNGSNPSLVKDINVAAPSYPMNFAKINDKSIFHSNNWQSSGLYISDGTFEGTEFLRDIFIDTSHGEEYTNFFKVGNDYFFRAKEVGEPSYSPNHLYKTDGTAQGTSLVSNEVEVADSHNFQNELYEEFNGKLYFLGFDGETGYFGHDLWVSDGTSNGTLKVYDFQNEGDNGAMITSMKNFGGYLYFTMYLYNGFTTLGRQVWRTDGTVQGTEVIFEATNEYWQTSQPPYILGEIDGKLIFVNTNEYYAQYPDTYIELYSIDQNNGEPQKFFTMDALPYQGGVFARTTSIEYQNQLFMPIMLFTDNNELRMSFLKTNGTTEGTHHIGEITDSYGIDKLKVCGNFLYFNESYTGNHELWRTDGTLSGTIKLRQLLDFYGNYGDIACHKNNLYFSVKDSDDSDPENPIDITTFEVTNGYSNEVHQIHLNRIDNEPIYEINNLYSDGNLLYLTLTENIHGNELYITNPDFVLSTEEINEGLTDKSSKFLIYPNPTSSEINIFSTDKSKIQQVQLYDLTGKLLELGMYNSNEVKLNLSKYSAGIYLVKVKTEKNTSTQKVILK